MTAQEVRGWRVLRSSTLLGVFLAQTAYFFWLAQHRFVAGDEGYYFMAAKLVATGSTPYFDFFYPQMPLLPYVYGAWGKIFGFSWSSARALSVVFAAGTGVMLFHYIWARRSFQYATLSLVLYLGSTLVFPWMALLKTYALSTFLAFACYVVTLHWKRWLLGGVLLGLAINVRLFFAPLGLIIAAYLIAAPYLQNSPRLRPLLYFSLGTVLTLLPNIYLAVHDFAAYWFNNIGYHLIRSGAGAEAEARFKVTLAKLLFGLKTSKQHEGIQFGMLCAGSLLLGVWSILRERRLDACLPLAIGLTLLSFVPTPPYLQYFSCAVPFFVVALIVHLPRDFAPSVVRRGAYLCFGVLALGVYMWSVPAYLKVYTESGKGVPWIKSGEGAVQKLPGSIEAVSHAINTLTTPGEEVLALWPGYLVSSHAKPVRGLENHFGLRVADRISEQRRRRYHILSIKDVCRKLKRGEVRVAVLESRAAKKGCLSTSLEEGGFRRRLTEQGVQIFVRANVVNAPQVIQTPTRSFIDEAHIAEHRR